MGDQVEVLRSFNRAYTRRIGVLEESYLGTGRALGPSRLLFEIADEGSPAVDLRRRMGLDSGYLSRLLRRLEQDRLVTVERDPEDGRRRLVRLTGSGRRARRRLDERSEQLAADLLDPLTPRLRSELAAALATAERLVRAATAEFAVVDPGYPPARQALDSYFAELDARFPTGFAPGEAGAPEDAAGMSPPRGAFLVVADDADVVGCGGVALLDDTTAEVKRMWIDPAWRGLGLGPRLLAKLEAQAVTLGRSRVVLDTNTSLSEAIALYRRAGYRAIDRYNANPYAQHWFEKHLNRA